MKIAAFLVSLLAAAPAMAQEGTEFTTQDAEEMTACLQELADAAPNDAAQGEAAPRSDCIGTASNTCMENEEGGYSTIGMAECMARETDWWDSQLNTHYAGLREKLNADLFSGLQEAQRAWIAYRDQSCGFEYQLWSEGTIRSIVFASCMLDHTAERALTLADYIERTP